MQGAVQRCRCRGAGAVQCSECRCRVQVQRCRCRGAVQRCSAEVQWVQCDTSNVPCTARPAPLNPASVHLQLNDASATLPGTKLSLCADSPAAIESCPGWSKAGECSRNPAFMHGTCAASCGLCADLGGPLIPVQQLRTSGASAMRAFAVGKRQFIGVSETGKVSIYEWRPRSEVATVPSGNGPWGLFAEISISGVCELAHGVLSDGTHLLSLATWHSFGSHAGQSHVYRIDLEGNDHFLPLQAISSPCALSALTQRARRCLGVWWGVLVLSGNTHPRPTLHVHHSDLSTDSQNSNAPCALADAAEHGSA